MYNTLEMSVACAVPCAVACVTAEGARVCAMLLREFYDTGMVDVEEEADVFAIRCLEMILDP